MNSAIRSWIMAQVALLALLLSWNAFAVNLQGFNLTQLGEFRYDAAIGDAPKTPAQEAADALYDLGIRHVVLVPEATMPNGTASIIVPKTPAGAEIALERQRYIRFIKYLKSKGMTVGIRPILLVTQDPADQGKYWHGNIKPSNVLAWFDSLRSYLDIYANIAKAAGVNEFTMGAELYSMTVGLEDQWPEQPYGFPREWSQRLKELKDKLGPQTQVMYDINYTDLTANGDGTGASGGELERWRYRLVDLKPDPAKPATMKPENVAAWGQLRDLWQNLDRVGVDVYRSLMKPGESIPDDYAGLEKKLEARALEHATDLDSKLFDIELALGFPKKVVLKEVGFKSCTGCFVDPGAYDDPKRPVNIEHQAAAYQAIFNAYVKPKWGWLEGIDFWDFSVSPNRAGMSDPGFSPRGKPMTEEIIRKGWLN